MQFHDKLVLIGMASFVVIFFLFYLILPPFLKIKYLQKNIDRLDEWHRQNDHLAITSRGQIPVECPFCNSERAVTRLIDAPARTLVRKIFDVQAEGRIHYYEVRCGKCNSVKSRLKIEEY